MTYDCGPALRRKSFSINDLRQSNSSFPNSDIKGAVLLLLGRTPQGVLLLLGRTPQGVLLLLGRTPQGVLLLLGRTPQGVLLLLGGASYLALFVSYLLLFRSYLLLFDSYLISFYSNFYSSFPFAPPSKFPLDKTKRAEPN